MAHSAAPHRFTAEDDNFHAGADPWWTETSWFSFNRPERHMSCWLHGWVRPNLKSGGGVFVRDDSATAPCELPYHHYLYTPPLPEERDLRAFMLRIDRIALVRAVERQGADSVRVAAHRPR